MNKPTQIDYESLLVISFFVLNFVLGSVLE